jgi:hypothetical protein
LSLAKTCGAVSHVILLVTVVAYLTSSSIGDAIGAVAMAARRLGEIRED